MTVRPADLAAVARRWPREAVVAPIRAYRAEISPGLGQRCKYYPSCSEYAIQAVREYGILRGLILAAWRLLRCNPLSHGGMDPVSAQRLFRRGIGAPQG